MRPFQKKTPTEATDFEREQLRFFLSSGNLTEMLIELNPSLAWLPMLSQMNLIKDEKQLVPWVERNFADPEAVREVAANIHYFGPESAEILEFGLNKMGDQLAPLLLKSWRLVIRGMRNNRRGLLRTDWFEIAPRVKRGDTTLEVLERICRILKPELEVGKRFRWSDDGDKPAERPSDLMSLEYEVADDVTGEEVLSVWPKDTAPDIDERLLHLLTQSLEAVLADAVEVGVESNVGYGKSDSDVPSVASHKQNAYHSGFLPIVRVIADLWTRLARKDNRRARSLLDRWQASVYRLIRRLALFAAADPAVPPARAAEVMLTIPQGELFLTSSTVEVYRLARERWHEFPPDKQEAIEARIIEGPPQDWYREGAELERLTDRARFDLLGELQRSGAELTKDSQAVFEEIIQRWPNWQLRPTEQAGFHIWTGGVTEVVSDPDKLKNVPDNELVAAAKQAQEKADFLEGDAWEMLCRSEPDRALRGLKAQADVGEWPAWAWRPFLWAGDKIEDTDTVCLIAELLLNWPQDEFSEISDTASWWLNQKATVLNENSYMAVMGPH